MGLGALETVNYRVGILKVLEKDGPHSLALEQLLASALFRYTETCTII
jgi:hypothetical protein